MRMNLKHRKYREFSGESQNSSSVYLTEMSDTLLLYLPICFFILLDEIWCLVTCSIGITLVACMPRRATIKLPYLAKEGGRTIRPLTAALIAILFFASIG